METTSESKQDIKRPPGLTFLTSLAAAIDVLGRTTYAVRLGVLGEMRDFVVWRLTFR